MKKSKAILGAVFALFLMGNFNSVHCAEAYKVGGLYPLTGGGAYMGVPIHNGSLLHVEEINSKGGINGHPIEFIVYDTEGKPEKAVSMANRLIKHDRVGVIAGPIYGYTAQAVLNLNNEQKIVSVSTNGSVPYNPDRDWQFAVFPSGETALEKFLMWCQKRNIKKIAIISATDPMGENGDKYLKERTKAYGITITDIKKFNNQDVDVTAQLSALNASGTEAIIAWTSVGTPAATVVKNAAQIGIKIPIVNSHSAGNKAWLDLVGKNTPENLYALAVKFALYDKVAENDPNKVGMRRFQEAYQKRWGKPGSMFEASGYDQISFIEYALEKVGMDSNAMRESIRGIKNFVGVNFLFTDVYKDNRGVDPNSMIMLKAQDGEWTMAE